jgi:predicted NBD/HSP70 family sugar kinase
VTTKHATVHVTSNRHELVRRANIEMVFRAIGEHAPASRNDLVRVTGLSKPTVLGLVAALEQEGLIRTARLASEPRGAGRRPVGYEHNPQAAYVIGVDVGGTKTAVAIADLSGGIKAEMELSTSQSGGDTVVRQITDTARAVARQAGITWSAVDAIGIGTPGVQDSDGAIRMADNVPGLDGVRLVSSVRRILRVPVLLENDVNLAALGELVAGAARGRRSFVLISIGTGLGLGIIVDGQLVRGARGAAGEIAYLPIGGDPSSTAGRRRGAFELVAAGSGVTQLVVDELSAAVRKPVQTPLNKSSTARDVYAAAEAGDQLALRVARRHAQIVSRGVLVVAALLDPEVVVLGGGIGSNPLMLAALRSEVDPITPWPVVIEPAELGTRAGLIGAVHHALRSLPEIESRRVSLRLQNAEL